MNRVQRGFWAGTFATSVMTLAFMELFKYLPKAEKSPLPPGTITDDLLQKENMRPATAEVRAFAAMNAHFGYGAACALLYSMFADRSKLSGIPKGMSFGFGVWFISYLGLLPALNVRARALNMPARRNLLMIVSHLIWGATLGYSEERLRSSGQKMFDGDRKSPNAE